MTDFPFTLRGLDHWKAYRGSDLFKERSAGYAEPTGGNEVAALSYYGTRPVTYNKPIISPADIDGLEIRVPNTPAHVLFPKEVGADPMPMAFSEVYLGVMIGKPSKYVSETDALSHVAGYCTIQDVSEPGGQWQA